MRTRRLRGGFVVSGLVTLALILAACPEDPEPEVAEPEPDVEDVDPDEVEPDVEAEMTIGHFMSTEHPMHVHLMEPLAERVAEATDGRVQLTIHPGGALGPPDAQYDNVIAGAMDVAFGLQGYTPGRFPLTEAVTLPFLFESADEATEALHYALEHSPELQEEYGDVKVLALWTHDTGQLQMRDELVQSPEDLQGQEIIATTRVVADLVEALGGTPVVRPVTEVYDSIERGVVDGVMLPLSTLVSFNLEEVVNYVTVGDFYVDTFFLAMNLESWEALSPEDQATLEDLIGEELALQAADAFAASEQVGFERMEEAGIEIYELSDEERDAWSEQAQVVHEEWIAAHEAEGLPAQAVYDTVIEFIGQQ